MPGVEQGETDLGDHGTELNDAGRGADEVPSLLGRRQRSVVLSSSGSHDGHGGEDFG